MRGKPLILRIGREPTRITPADAGKTADPARAVRFATGSPPRMRGKRLEIRALTGAERITPAGAGKTPPGGMLLLPEQDHPRRCGENRPSIALMSKKTGSPPQVRGKLNCDRRICRLQRITPAGAGKTCIALTVVPNREDHPRRCGEN